MHLFLLLEELQLSQTSDFTPTPSLKQYKIHEYLKRKYNRANLSEKYPWMSRLRFNISKTFTEKDEAQKRKKDISFKLIIFITSGFAVLLLLTAGIIYAFCGNDETIQKDELGDKYIWIGQTYREAIPITNISERPKKVEEKHQTKDTKEDDVQDSPLLDP